MTQSEPRPILRKSQGVMDASLHALNNMDIHRIFYPLAVGYAGGGVKMRISAEVLGPRSATRLFGAGAHEVLIPCIGSLEDAAAQASRISEGPVTLHVPANRVANPDHAVAVLAEHGIERALVVSGNPGHGGGSTTLYELIPRLREHNIHVSVGAYPESYFSTTGARHRMRSARILRAKQEAGAQRVTTQVTFDRANLRTWVAVLREHGVDLPLQIGVSAPVPRTTLGRVLRQARADILRYPARHTLSRANLDLFYRMLRSRIPDPARHIWQIGEMDVLRPHDGFHLFTYGADIQPLMRALSAVNASQRLAGRTLAADASVENMP